MNKFLKFGIAAALAALVGFGGPSFAQLNPPLNYLATGADADAFQDIQGGYSGTINKYLTGSVLRSYIFGSNSLHTGKPVLTSCITGSGTIVGTDYAFILTGGSTASTSCVATFSVAYNAIPICQVSSQTAYGTTTASFAVSTTAVTITQASGSSNVYDVTCTAQPGG